MREMREDQSEYMRQKERQENTLARNIARLGLDQIKKDQIAIKEAGRHRKRQAKMTEEEKSAFRAKNREA